MTENIRKKKIEGNGDYDHGHNRLENGDEVYSRGDVSQAPNLELHTKKHADPGESKSQYWEKPLDRMCV